MAQWQRSPGTRQHLTLGTARCHTHGYACGLRMFQSGLQVMVQAAISSGGDYQALHAVAHQSVHRGTTGASVIHDDLYTRPRRTVSYLFKS